MLPLKLIVISLVFMTNENCFEKTVAKSLGAHRGVSNGNCDYSILITITIIDNGQVERAATGVFSLNLWERKKAGSDANINKQYDKVQIITKEEMSK